MIGFGANIESITANSLKSLIDNSEKIVILDVRTEQEVSRGKIEGSINIPLDQIDTAEKILTDKNANIYVYCLSGSRSIAAAKKLQKMGYQKVYNLQNGLLSWRAHQFHLVQ